MKEVEAMIDFILKELRRHGTVVPDALGTAVMVAVHSEYGGERVYVPKLPKLQKAVRVQQAGQGDGRSQAETARVSGLSVRHVRRLQRGR